MEDKLKEFLEENKVSFENLIRCYNFWDKLKYEEKTKYVENYFDGKYKNIGWY